MEIRTVLALVLSIAAMTIGYIRARKRGDESPLLVAGIYLGLSLPLIYGLAQLLRYLGVK